MKNLILFSSMVVLTSCSSEAWQAYNARVIEYNQEHPYRPPQVIVMQQPQPQPSVTRVVLTDQLGRPINQFLPMPKFNPGTPPMPSLAPAPLPY